MDDRQTAAVAALAEGKTIEEASNDAGRSSRTVMKWLEDLDFQAAVIRGLRALALLTLAQYLKHGTDPKAGQAALATLRWLGAGKPGKPPKDPKEPAGEEETDIGEFSKDQLRRVEGDG